LVLDRLGSGFLGPYGNTWVETQSCNRLASQGLLCEFMVSDSPELESVYRSYWTGCHAMGGRLAEETLPEAAARAGLRTILLTDEPKVAEHPLAIGFAERILLPADELAAAAKEIEETQIARLTQAALEVLARQREPYLLWIHSRGMSGSWDAPLEYRNAFRDEDDPQPGEFTAPPLIRKSGPFDPDELLRYVHAYAGQVTVMDLCLGALLDAAEEHPMAQDALVAITSPRGYPLGEHGQVGPVEDALYGEVLNVPLILRLPGGGGALTRTQELIQPGDLHELLRAQLVPGSPSLLLDIAEGRDHPPRDIACAVAKGERAIRTPAWFLREVRKGDDEPRVELFAKSDDRWEVNEVASRAADVAEELKAALDTFEQAAREGRLDELAPLAETLSNQWR
ncbi:MAG: sulfatase-like hydrolase/transferase, partial [Pirellulaceae bacterium]|nr:sulfatase-like hydrolase/transferase [Pirellulaceae bacterium]